MPATIPTKVLQTRSRFSRLRVTIATRMTFRFDCQVKQQIEQLSSTARFSLADGYCSTAPICLLYDGLLVRRLGWIDGLEVRRTKVRRTIPPTSLAQLC